MKQQQREHCLQHYLQVAQQTEEMTLLSVALSSKVRLNWSLTATVHVPRV